MSVMHEAKSTRALPGAAWSIDPDRSSVRFAIKHMGLKTLRGAFHDFEGSIDLSSPTPSAAGTVRAASIDTGESIRDEHLRQSADFFDVEHHPEIIFTSTRIEAGDRGRLLVEGVLTMRGDTREISLEGELIEGTEAGRIELDLKGELNRKDFGLTWNQALDAGGALLGNKVKIELRLSALA